MPRTILVRPPGGSTGRVRRRYAVRQKLQLLEECNRLRRLENLSLRGNATVMSIPHTILIASLGRQKAICKGPVRQLDGNVTLEQKNNATMFLNAISNVDPIFY